MQHLFYKIYAHFKVQTPTQIDKDTSESKTTVINRTDTPGN